MATLKGDPGQSYQVLSGRTYTADGGGLIQNVVALADIRELRDAGCELVPSGQPLTNPLPSPEISLGRNRGGRRRKSAWNSVVIEILRIADLHGLPPNRHDLHRQVMEFCATVEGPPDESAIRELLGQLYDESWMRAKLKE